MSIKVLDPGVHSVIQDGGRYGLARYGVPCSGAFDQASWRLANELVGNDVPAEFVPAAGPAAIEVLLGGLRLEVTVDAVVAVSGAQVPITVLDVDDDDKRLGSLNAAIELTAGSRIHLGMAKQGLRTYLAVSGGLITDYTLGSRSTDTTSGLGPNALEKNRVINVGPRQLIPAPRDAAPRTLPSIGTQTDVQIWATGISGDADRELAASISSTAWTVSPTSSRAGVRLTLQRSTAGPAVDAGAGKDTHAAQSAGIAVDLASRASAPTQVGTIQALPDGELVVIGPDGPTTGGYPVVGVLDRDGIDTLAQARPGCAVRLLPVGEAQ